MCGIAGFHGRGSLADLTAMNLAQHHRGPDGEGAYQDHATGMFLGHRRLAIIDLATGAQPMWNEDASVAVVFNGEIYNHADLRRELIACGHRFSTDHSDTEVLVHGYEEWGDGLPERLNGMFAFAIFDRPRRRIFLARDRFGEKPLHYFHRDGAFAFASELRALARHPACSSSLDLTGLRKYFAYGYLPSPWTHLEGCRKLPPGHHLTFDLDQHSFTVQPYWRFRLEPDPGLLDRPEAELAEELTGLIRTAVRRRMMSDVPLGIFLSGGLDSSTILALASEGMTGPPQAFTVGFTEASFDETVYARAMAEHCGARFHHQTLDFATATDLLPRLTRQLDEPFGDPSILPTYQLCAFTRQQVTVALSGDGGDELFGGYDPLLALKPARLYDALIPKVVHRAVRSLADLLPISHGYMGLDFKVRRALLGLSYREQFWVPAWMSALEPSAIAELFRAPIQAEDLYSEALQVWDECPSSDPLDKALSFFTRIYLADDILTKTDRAAMLVSLESRAVFLDNDIVSFCQRLPSQLKLKGRQRKHLLKLAVANLLPQSIISRRKKGFGVPIADWFRKIPYPQFVNIPGVDHGYAAKLWEQHRAGQRDHRLFVWNWMALQQTLAGSAPS